jgi:hypothetical protein
VSSLREARLSRLYEIKGPLSANQAHQAARDLLNDPVTQEFRVVTPAPAPLNGMNFWRVEVWLKPTVSDPVGDTVREALACRAPSRCAARSSIAWPDAPRSPSWSGPWRNPSRTS